MAGLIIDLSSNNHVNGTSIDWSQVRAAGVTTAFIKATEGTGYTNPYYVQDMAGAKAAGIDTAAYHFAAFGDDAAEVAYFKSVAGADAKILDAETNTDAAWQQDFLSQLGPQRMLYGSLSTIQRQIPVLLWIASYGADPGSCAAWQYTSLGTVPGIQGSVDLSHWEGSQQQYDEFIGAAPPPTSTEAGMLVAGNPVGAPGDGYWCVTPDGAVFAYGTAQYHGGANLGGGADPTKADLSPRDTITGFCPTSDGGGYWLSSASKGLFAYGNARFVGHP
jgi:lysozyme